MSFAGHVFDMISRIKANESQKKHRRARRQHVMDAWRGATATALRELKKETLTREELHQVKMNIRRNLRKERQLGMLQNVLIGVLCILILALLVYLAEWATGYKWI